ncbi:hypothetical protein CHS0354_008845 [Potamilus streckersoni]|uniref:Solute carrier organic anion transporter family member n=1 Tax=Potamilus streckersoni TaxID=2493646 RepID=A0AAE0W2S1_9BIVA|nr:hypothetical protein CHS0354_008845 [Potamilus streckersoni]
MDDNDISDADNNRVTDKESDLDVRCGYGNCKPGWLQKLNQPKILLALLCIFTALQGFVVNGVNNVNTSTLERRFQLPSSRVGLISSAYDFVAAIVGIFASFYGSRYHKARWLSLAAVAFGAGSFTMALPHFTTGLYQSGDGISKTCTLSQNPEQCKDEGLQNYIYVLMFGQCLHGLGGAVLFTVGVGLIDDSVPATSSPLYLGIFYGCSLLGPGIGYIVGGNFLNIYVDFEQVDSGRMTTSDPRWVGAWWLGFLLSCGLFWIIAIPLSAFGAELPTSKSIRDNRVSLAYKDDGKSRAGSENGAISILEFPAALYRLLRNPTYICFTIGGAAEGIINSGMATFLPKFIQNQYNLAASSAAILTGLVVIPGAAGGNFVGGLVCKCMKLKVKGMARLSFVGCLLTVLFFTVLFLRCDKAELVGVDHHYINSSAEDVSLTTQCNSECNCTTLFYEPVCDSDGLRYFSACHAGCFNTVTSEKVFSNCSCVGVQPGKNISMVTTEACQSSCSLIYVFLPIVFVALFCNFLPATPSDSAILRCIHDGDRTFGIGVKKFIIRMAGTVPGPILFGSVTDLTCASWSEKCGEKTSCWLYNSEDLARNYFLLIVCCKFVSSVFFLLAHLFYVPSKPNVLHALKESGEQEYCKTEISQDGSTTDNNDVNTDVHCIMLNSNSMQTKL